MMPSSMRHLPQIRAALEDCAAVPTNDLAFDLKKVRRATHIAHFDVAAHSKSRARSSAFAECVSAPTEIQSTPVSAIGRTV